ncbi:DNA-binding protein [Sphingobacterium alkalisoli]|uniref:DNA-binding protein n=1 Tax=Sphingobacterium alkalisoli TaxID=1874115 RepID=A0A4U0GXY1_9SPHI|nr:HU family DNA-binding protein [Sphingobacterium alkalisoli]TJY63524.1 DNA-binding protein [Sphingobacterium alkalisoli]GGH26617.1 DNA-binding protein [Sphingobacterium alkalisoli]
MAINYNVVEIGKPGDLTAPKKFYARPVTAGEILLEDLAADISHASSVTEADVYAVLQSLVREIPRNISRGYIVRLGNLGSFRLGSNSTGNDTREEVNAANIVRTRLLFHAGKQLKTTLSNLTFKKVE